MTGLVRSEWLKLRSTRVLWALAAAVGALTVVQVVGILLVTGTGGFELDGFGDLVRGAVPTGVTPFALVLGIIAATGEFRHGTATPTFLTVPVRWRVLVAKVLTMVAVGLAFGLLAVVLAIVVGLPLSGLRDVELALGADAAGPVLGSLVSGALWAALGVGVGALVRNQVVAIVGALVYLLIVETAITAFRDDIGRWLVGGAGTALLGGGLDGAATLSVATGVAVFLGYVVLLNVLGWFRTARSDIAGE